MPAPPISIAHSPPRSAPGRVARAAAGAAREDPAQGRGPHAARGEEIARIATLEMGKTIHETRIELQARRRSSTGTRRRAPRLWRVLPQRLPGQRMTIVKEPVGPVAAFAPWNFPLGNPARKIGAALAAGCTCILKPAEEAAGTALAVARALHEAGCRRACSPSCSACRTRSRRT
jgi:succinate-semialdehyde dehydrogenase/glutarate-semialdehyde dehydrogenase